MRVPGRVIGRDDLIVHVVEQLGAGGAMVTLVGDPGIGKTTVWTEALSRVEAAWAWSVRCLQVEAQLGLSVLADFFAAMPDDVCETLPAPQRRAIDVVLYRDDDRDDVRGGDRVLGVTTLSLLRALVARGPVVLGVDDLQWCDSTSFEALGYALRRLADVRVSVLATRRAGVGSDFPNTAEIPVEPLGASAVEQVIRATVGHGIADGVLSDLVARCGGNPFFARELARQLTERPTQQTLPPSLRAMLAHRLDRADPQTRSVLLDVAVRGAPVLADFEPADLRSATDADIVYMHEGRVRFTHPLLASAVLENASSSELRTAHRRAAAAGSDPVETVLHRARCEEPSDNLAAAADAAVTTALRRRDRAGARDLAQLALDATPAGERTCERLLLLTELEEGLGNFERVAALARELVGVADSPTARAVGMTWIAAELPGEESIAPRQEAAALPGLPEEIRQELVGAIANLMFESGRTAEAVSTIEGALTTASESWPELIGTLAFLKRCAGLPDDGVALDDVVARSRELMATVDETFVAAQSAIGTAAQIAMLDDRHDEAERLLVEAMDVAARSGEADMSGYIVGMLSFRTGHLDDAVPQLRDAAPDGYDSPFGPARLALVHAWRGDAAEARTCIDAASVLTGSAGHRCWAEINFAAGFLDLLTGNIEKAWPALREAAAQLDAIGYREPSHPAVLPAAIEAAAALGQLDVAEKLCQRLERDSAALNSRFGAAAARRSRGFLAQGRHDDAEAEACFAESAEVFRSLGVPLEGARAHLALGCLLRRTGQRRRARDTLQAALDVFIECGASGLVQDCHNELGRISGRAASTTAELTDSERRVAELVATGMRNVDVARALHLSVKTVETHLGHAYRKLGITNRTELTRRLDTQDQDETGRSSESI